MADFLVTGGAGFIGSNIVDRLVFRGHRVTVLDDFSSGKEDNLSVVSAKIRLVRGDVRDRDDVRSAMKGAELVLHLAAIPSVQQSVENPVLIHDVNVNGTLNILEEARKAGVKRLVLSSSCSVYGDSLEIPLSEAVPPNPLSPYALSKLIGEDYCRLYHLLYGLETVCLRYFNVFGPKQNAASDYAAVVPKFINALLDGESPKIYGSGEQTRDFVFVEDVFNANLNACNISIGKCGKVFNIAEGREVSVNGLLSAIKNITGSSETAEYFPARPGEVMRSAADTRLAERNLGFKASYSLEKGLDETISWFRKNR